jgi:hypothetical protein
MTTRTTGSNIQAIERAIKGFGDASFQCGEWNRNGSDEAYDVVVSRALAAEDTLRRLLGIQRNTSSMTKPRGTLGKLSEKIGRRNAESEQVLPSNAAGHAPDRDRMRRPKVAEMGPVL